MPDNPNGLPRFDTRGLPEGFDPRRLYEYRTEKRSKSATGLEGLIYKYVPHNLIRSFAFAIDPLRDFKVAPGVITPVNRHAIIGTASVLQQGITHRKKVTKRKSSKVNYLGVGGCYGPVDTIPDVVHFDYDEPGLTQAPLPFYRDDTTRRTRLIGSSQGEFKMFKPTLTVSGRQLHEQGHAYGFATSVNCSEVGNYPQINDAYDYESYDIGAPAAVFPLQTYNSRRALEELYADSLIQQNVLKMVKGYSPSKREYTLFRNLVELHDVPRSVTNLFDTAKNLRTLYSSLGYSSSSTAVRNHVFNLKTSLKDIPKEYVSYHFGWKQLYKDVKDLLDQPAKVSKKLNFLIRRNGKPTTFRTSKKFARRDGDVSGFEMPIYAIEREVKLNNHLESETELRLVINRTFDFPDIDTPKFRHKFMLEQLGIVPRPTDLYNLVPWSWLVDWFTGCGDYIDHMDNINRDDQLINWGMITAETQGRITATYTSKTRDYDFSSVNGKEIYYETLRDNPYSASLYWTYQKRIDIASALDLNATSDPGTLTDYQKSILGALLAQRVKITK